MNPDDLWRFIDRDSNEVDDRLLACAALPGRYLPLGVDTYFERGVDRVLVVEQCFGGQFYRYLRSHYDLPGAVRSFCEPGPLPIRPQQVCEALENWG